MLIAADSGGAVCMGDEFCDAKLDRLPNSVSDRNPEVQRSAPNARPTDPISRSTRPFSRVARESVLVDAFG